MEIKSPFLLFEEAEHFFVFDGGDGTLIELPQLYFDILKYTKLYNLYDEEDMKELIAILERNYEKEKIVQALIDIRKNNQKGFLNKYADIYKLYDKKTNEKQHNNSLWINISHDCNLRCEYCFGNGGDYGHKRILMSSETAKQCIDTWYSQIDSAQSLLEVNFFGGEPLMNQKTMIFCVEYINELFKNKKNKIRYNITTNGTIINEKILKLFAENHFKVSISIDGIEKLHDSKRKYASGRGSFSDIRHNIREIKKYIPKLAAQITLSKEGIPHLVDAVQELWDMGINMVYSNLVFGEEVNYTYEEYATYHSEIKKLSLLTYQNIIEKKPYNFQNLINDAWAIKNKRFSTNCFFWGGGAMIFSPEGERYRCYRFMENKKYELTDNNCELLEKKPHVDKCCNCWAQLLCADGCVYENSIYSDNMNDPSEEWCTKTKISLEEALKLYARIVVKNPDLVEKIFRR